MVTEVSTFLVISVLVILLGNEFHNEIVLGTKECKKEFVWAKG